MTEYPATVTVHWPTGPVDCCKEHARQLFALNDVLGGHLVQTHAAEGAECSNCVNENREKTDGGT